MVRTYRGNISSKPLVTSDISDEIYQQGNILKAGCINLNTRPVLKIYILFTVCQFLFGYFSAQGLLGVGCVVHPVPCLFYLFSCIKRTVFYGSEIHSLFNGFFSLQSSFLTGDYYTSQGCNK